MKQRTCKMDPRHQLNHSTMKNTIRITKTKSIPNTGERCKTSNLFVQSKYFVTRQLCQGIFDDRRSQGQIYYKTDSKATHQSPFN